jgi:hypothetical protein
MAKQKPIGFLSDFDDELEESTGADLALLECFELVILNQYGPADTLQQATDLMSSQEVKDLMQMGTISSIKKTLTDNGFKQHISGSAAMWMMIRK